MSHADGPIVTVVPVCAGLPDIQTTQISVARGSLNADSSAPIGRFTLFALSVNAKQQAKKTRSEASLDSDGPN